MVDDKVMAERNQARANMLLHMVEVANKNRQDFASAFLLVRRFEGMTQANMADLFKQYGYPYQTQHQVSRFERGLIGTWTPEMLSLLISWLGITLDDFYSRMCRAQTFLISGRILFS